MSVCIFRCPSGFLTDMDHGLKVSNGKNDGQTNVGPMFCSCDKGGIARMQIILL